MSWYQRTVVLKPKPQGFHLITEEVLAHVPEIRNVRLGIAHLFLQHTSASLTLNENTDPEVRADLEAHFDQLAPERAAHYTHTYEGPDDMPAHIKSALLGCSVTVPVTEGRFNLGTWQGIYLCEHRTRGGPRRLVLTVFGEEERRGTA